MNTKRGITLLALVITIIVLLILAGVTIALVLGETSVINRAKEGQIVGRYSTVRDRADIWENENRLNLMLKEKIVTRNDFVAELIADKLVVEGEYDETTGIITIGTNIINLNEYIN